MSCPPELLIDDGIAVVATEIGHHPPRKFPNNTTTFKEHHTTLHTNEMFKTFHNFFEE